MTSAGNVHVMEASFDSLTLTKRVRISDITDYRTFNDHAGDFDKVVHSDGGWEVFDRSDGGNTFILTPPPELEPTFVEDEFVSRRYREAKVAEVGNVIDVTIDFLRASPRDPENTNDVLTESAGSDDWKLDFQHGTIATPLVSATNQREQDDIKLEMNLGPKEAEVIMENPTYINAVSVETVPDGDDFIRDNNPDNRNTVTITRPSSEDTEYLPNSGVDYIVQDWTLEWTLASERYDVVMTVRQK